MDEHRIRVGITQGDINGIGYEVIIKALMDPRILDVCTPVVYGSPKVLAYHRKALNIPNFSLNSVATAREANPRRANLINCLDDNARVELGKASGYSGEAAFIALEMAVHDLVEHQIDLLVTAPINKHTIQSKDFNFAGHTEYLQEKLAALPGWEVRFSGPVYNEFVISCPDPAKVNQAWQESGIVGGYALGKDYPELKNGLVLCGTEMLSRTDIDDAVAIAGEVR